MLTNNNSKNFQYDQKKNEKDFNLEIKCEKLYEKLDAIIENNNMKLFIYKNNMQYIFNI